MLVSVGDLFRQYRVIESAIPDEVQVFQAKKRLSFRHVRARATASLDTRINAAYLPNLYLSG